MPISYRPLADMADFERMVDLEIAIWGVSPRDAVPANLLRALSSHGGLVLGAYDNDQLVGLTVAFRASSEMLWSHMTGVHPAYQGRGIGLGLKRVQREWALGNGCAEIRWTFDPIQRGNAHFNLHLLGAQSNLYHDNYYGDMDDDINRGMPSDRLEAVWPLRDVRVGALMHGAVPAAFTPPVATAVSITDEQPFVLVGEPDWLCVTIPPDLAPLRQAGKLLDARLRLRQIMREMFSRGYTAVDFVNSAYLLRKIDQAG
jgi:predicted GNAT superfamily acetyltransferase